MFDLNLLSSELTGHLRRARRERAATIAIRLRGAATAVREGIAAFAASRARRRLHRQTVRELQGLSDRTLGDIGIPRGAIWAVADELVNGVAGSAVGGREPPQPARFRREAASQNQAQKRTHAPMPVAAGCG